MEQYPANYPQSPPPQSFSQPMSFDDPNKMQQNPQAPPPQYTSPPAGPTTYYPQGQPTQAYPGYPTAPPPQQQQQQQQSVVFVNAQAPMIVQQAPLESYCGHQIFACFVFWCCNLPFGLIAWILALVADTHTKYTDRAEARCLGKASIGMSVSGIIVSVIIVAVVIGVTFGTVRNYDGCWRSINGVCYSSQRYVGYCSYYSASYCCKSYENFYYNSYCYTT